MSKCEHEGGAFLSFFFFFSSALHPADDACSDRFGIHCARLAALPDSLLEQASIKSKELEEKTLQRSIERRQARAAQLAKMLFDQSQITSLAGEQLEQIRIAARVLDISL